MYSSIKIFFLSLGLNLGFLPPYAKAEYRVFTLHIVDKSAPQAGPLTRQIETTLDPQQYITYYPLKSSERISYIETWRCPGRTDFFKSHCDNPRLLDRSPATVPSQSPEVLK